jgi:hypothetical protein
MIAPRVARCYGRLPPSAADALGATTMSRGDIACHAVPAAAPPGKTVTPVGPRPVARVGTDVELTLRLHRDRALGATPHPSH